ncbi:MAG TPA: LptF/LptG family permease, partial [Prolixibacteraceae bacterium]
NLAMEQALSIAYPLPVATALNSMARRDPTKRPEYKLKKYVDIDSVLRSAIPPVRKQLIEGALTSARNNIRAIKQVDELNVANIRSLNRFDTEWHKKYTYSLACLIFFFIGAPLGAIIRKGGLGMPVVVSILMFIAYYILMITGEKFAREDAWSMAEGMWFSSFVFLPLGIWLTYKAATDSSVMNIESYQLFFKKLLSFKFLKRKKPEQ